MELNKPITIITIKPIGEIKLRYVTLHDMEVVFKLTKQELNEKEFVKKFLFNQITNTDIAIEEFIKLSDEDIEKIARKFVKDERSISEYLNDTGDFFKDFKEAIIHSSKEYDKQLCITIQPFIDSQKSVIETVGSITKYIQDFSESYANLYKNIERTNKLISTYSLPETSFFDNNLALGSITKAWDNFLDLNLQVKTNYFNSLGTISYEPPKASLLAIQEAGSQIKHYNELFNRNISIIPTYPSAIRQKVEDKISGSVDELHGYILSTRDNIEREFVYTYWKKIGETLQDQAERICEEALALALKQVLSDKKYKIHRQPIVSNGRIDIIIDFYDGTKIDTVILELKVFRDGDDKKIGVNQSFEYLRLKKVNYGYRIIFNSTKLKLHDDTHHKEKMKIKDVIININPTRPSDL